MTMLSIHGLKSYSQILLLAATGTALSACDDDPLIHQDDAATVELYEERTEGWVRWALEQAWSTGPVLDPDGSACANGQSGNTWFLAGTSGGSVERECTIPAGKKLFFPLINRWYALQHLYITDEKPIEYWTGRANLFFDTGRANTCELTLRIDGQDLLPDFEALDEELYVRVDEPFEIEVLDDNFASSFGLPAGPRTTWADGHYALLSPLPPGDYTLELGGRICDAGATTFETLATYTLHIVD